MTPNNFRNRVKKISISFFGFPAFLASNYQHTFSSSFFFFLTKKNQIRFSSVSPNP